MKEKTSVCYQPFTEKILQDTVRATGMKPINIENVVGHSIGISDSYYHPTENDLLQEIL
jgi:hypothetical protein